MANRVIRDWTDSEKMDSISFQAEVLFIRLTMKADDYGSFHANIKLVKAALFPLKMDTVREADISRWMEELQKAGLIVFYTAESKSFLRILNFGQRMRTMKKRFPDMPSDNPPHSAASCSIVQAETKGKRIETENEDEGEGKSAPPFFSNPILDSLKQKTIEECQSEYFNSGTWVRSREQLCISEYQSQEQLLALSKEFNEQLIVSGTSKKEMQDWVKHFSNWIKNPNRKAAQQKNSEHATTETAAERRQRLIREQTMANTSGR